MNHQVAIANMKKHRSVKPGEILGQNLHPRCEPYAAGIFIPTFFWVITLGYSMLVNITQHHTWSIWDGAPKIAKLPYKWLKMVDITNWLLGVISWFINQQTYLGGPILYGIQHLFPGNNFSTCGPGPEQLGLDEACDLTVWQRLGLGSFFGSCSGWGNMVNIWWMSHTREKQK